MLLTRMGSLATALVMPVSACVCMLVWLAGPDSVLAQAGNPMMFTFDDARARQVQSADARSAARARVKAELDRAAATRHLHWPDVSLDVLGIGYQKSIDSLAWMAARAFVSSSSRARILTSTLRILI